MAPGMLRAAESDCRPHSTIRAPEDCARTRSLPMSGSVGPLCEAAGLGGEPGRGGGLGIMSIFTTANGRHPSVGTKPVSPLPGLERSDS